MAAAIVAGLAGAAATAGITLTSAQHPSHAAQSEGHAASAQTTPPVTFAPPSAVTRAGPEFHADPDLRRVLRRRVSA